MAASLCGRIHLEERRADQLHRGDWPLRVDVGRFQQVLQVSRRRSCVNLRADPALLMFVDGDDCRIRLSISTRTRERQGHRIGRVLVFTGNWVPAGAGESFETELAPALGRRR